MAQRYYIVANGALFREAMVFHSNALQKNTTVEDLILKTFKIFKETEGKNMENIRSALKPLPNDSVTEIPLQTKVTDLELSKNYLYTDRIPDDQCVQIFYQEGWLG